MNDKARIKKLAENLASLTDSFCDKCLNTEYKDLCRRMVLKLSRKRNVPFIYGKPEIWAATIVYAIGQINFLFDKSTRPYCTADDICKHFGTSKSTTGQKAKVIRDMLKLSYWNPEFSTKHMLESNPLKGFVITDGFIMPADDEKV